MGSLTKGHKSTGRMNKVDILAIGAHPDDVELSCAATLIKQISLGNRVGLCDLTKGELGTRGSAELRLKEAEAAREIIGADFRVNLGMADGFFDLSEANKLEIVKVIRACQPKILMCNALSDRHPDHARGAQLAKDAAFLAGLRRIETSYEGESQLPWRPQLVMHYIQDHYLKPELIMDVTDFWSQKLKAVQAFSSQFYDPKSKEPASPISSKEFMGVIEGRGLQFGRYINATYGEGFNIERPFGVADITGLI